MYGFHRYPNNVQSIYRGELKSDLFDFSVSASKQDSCPGHQRRGGDNAAQSQVKSTTIETEIKH